MGKANVLLKKCRMGTTKEAATNDTLSFTVPECLPAGFERESPQCWAKDEKLPANPVGRLNFERKFYIRVLNKINTNETPL